MSPTLRCTLLLGMLGTACAGDPEATDVDPTTDVEQSDGTDTAASGDTGESTATGQTSAASGLVTTTIGDIQGVEEDNGTWQFLGIPFAEPPVGALRWQPPVAASPLEAQPFVADTFGPACPQLSEGTVIGEEDCLTLNVWTPSDYSEDSALPVLFFIHGGANILGSAAQAAGPEALYTGRLLAEQEDVVVITVQYRLGPFGFLALPELSAESAQGASGNYAHLDLVAALEWVQDNIDQFGGDPGKVLTFGQSAGGLNACTLYASPLASGLFSSMLVQSGFCSHRTLQETEAEHSVGVSLFDECSDAADRLACLRALPAERIISTIPGSIEGSLGGDTIIYGPVVEGHLLPDAPLAIIARGEHNDVPAVFGSTADEMASDTLFTDEVDTTEAYEAYVAETYAELGEDAVATILETYPASAYDTPQDALIRLTTDQTFTRNTRLLARVAAMGSTSPTYRYVFSKRTSTAFSEIPARHGIDLMYVFNTLTTLPLFNPGPEDTAIADAMMASWAALARSGDPAVNTGWQPYDVAQDNHLDFGESVSTGVDYRTEECDMWDALFAP